MDTVSTILLFLGFPLAISLAAGFAMRLGLKWPATTVVGLGIVLFSVVFGSEFFGSLTPFVAMQASISTDLLERSLHVGESRAEVEGRFGKTIPTPEYFEPDARYDKHYAWPDSAFFCLDTKSGLTVHYNRQQRVMSWEPYSYASGC